MRIIKVPCEVYKADVEFWMDCSEKKFVSEMKKLGENLLEDGCSGMYIQIKEKKSLRAKRRIVWIEKYPKTIEQKAILVHELFHLVSSILSYKNIRLVMDDNGEYLGTSEESFAYLIEYYYKKIFELLKS